MSTGAIELPLFPLNVVLFPGMVLPLHIFEPRYRLMITECRNEHKPFGIVLVRPGSQLLHEDTYPIGTTAEIREIDELEDGRFNLITIGMQRFRILSRHRKKPYLSGLVEPYQDVPEPVQALADSVKQARVLFESYLNMLLEASGKETMEINLPTLPEELSYFIAYLLGAEDEQKQQLLELTSTLQRLQEEIAILRREVPFMRQMLVGDSHLANHPDRSMLN
jgi:Lon protease-like protein